MNIWNLKSVVIIWVFAWGWLQAFDSCASTRERWSVEHREEQVVDAKRAVRESELEQLLAEQLAERCTAKPDSEECQPEPTFLCRIFNCEEEEETSSP